MQNLKRDEGQHQVEPCHIFSLSMEPYVAAWSFALFTSIYYLFPVIIVIAVVVVIVVVVIVVIFSRIHGHSAHKWAEPSTANNISLLIQDEANED